MVQKKRRRRRRKTWSRTEVTGGQRTTGNLTAIVHWCSHVTGQTRLIPLHELKSVINLICNATFHLIKLCENFL